MLRRLAQQRMTLSNLEWPFTVRQYRPFRRDVHCDHTVHYSADLSLWLDNPMFWAS